MTEAQAKYSEDTLTVTDLIERHGALGLLRLAARAEAMLAAAQEADNCLSSQVATTRKMGVAFEKVIVDFVYYVGSSK